MVDQVVVVDHHHEGRVVDERVHQRGHDLGVVTGRADDERTDCGADRGPVAGDRGDECRPEASGVRVVGLHLQPGHVLGPVLGPGGEHGRLAEPAGALASTNGTWRASASSSTSCRRVRSTSRVGSAGGRSLVAAIPISPSTVTA